MTVAHNPFIASEVLVAERLLEAFDNQDPRFGEFFEAADRVTLAALVAYASYAIREVAARDKTSVRETRQRIRSRVATAAAITQAGEI